MPDIDLEYDGTTFMVITIAISSSVLVATMLGVGLLVLYCNLSLRLFNADQE